MRSCVVLLFASLLTLCEAQGTSVTPVFVLKGRDLLLKLHADPPERVLLVDWKFNETIQLVRIQLNGEQTVNDRFTGRVQLGENKFSVILKNVQEVDSGVYSAVAATLEGDKLLTEYKVTVQGPVSPVELIVDQVDNSSSESCDLHVTCRTHNSHINIIVRCVDRVCSQVGGEQPEVTTSGAFLQVYVLNNVISCKHNNQVHWTQDLIPAEQLCYPVAGVIVWLWIDRKRLIGLIQIYQATKEEAAQDETSAPPDPTKVVTYSWDVVKHLNEISASLEKNMSPAGASGPSYSSVPFAADPTDP